MTESPPPRRVVVTSPRTAAPRRPAPARVIQEIERQTAVGEVYIASLIRSQRRLAIFNCGLLAAVVGLTPPLLVLVAGDGSTVGRWLPWVVLGVLAYPFLAIVGWWHVRSAERYEREFVALVDPPDRA